MARIPKHPDKASKQKFYRLKKQGKTEAEIAAEFPELFLPSYLARIAMGTNHEEEVKVTKKIPKVTKSNAKNNDDLTQIELERANDFLDSFAKDLGVTDPIFPHNQRWWNNIRFMGWLASVFAIPDYGEMKLRELKIAIMGEIQRSLKK